MFILKHEDWKLWRKLNKMPIENFTLISDNADFRTYKVKGLPDDWQLNIYKGKCWISNPIQCVLSSFYKEASDTIKPQFLVIYKLVTSCDLQQEEQLADLAIK